jgi:hypothetical protein
MLFSHCITQVLSSTGADGVFTCSTANGRVTLTRSADATDTLADTQVSVTLSPVTNPVTPVDTAAFTVTLYTAAAATATGARRTEQGDTPGVSITHAVSVLSSAVTGPSDSVAVAGQSKEWLVQGVGMAADDQVKCMNILLYCIITVVILTYALAPHLVQHCIFPDTVDMHYCHCLLNSLPHAPYFCMSQVVFVAATATTDAHCSDAAYTILPPATVTAVAADATYSSITITFQVSYMC